MMRASEGRAAPPARAIPMSRSCEMQRMVAPRALRAARNCLGENPIDRDTPTGHCGFCIRLVTPAEGRWMIGVVRTVDVNALGDGVHVPYHESPREEVV